MLPFLISALVVVHISYLHVTGSSNNLGVKSLNTLIFHPFFSIKDILGVTLVLFLFIYLCLRYPLALGDDENFVIANPAVTPNHIQPE